MEDEIILEPLKEVFKIYPAYFKVSKKRKLRVLKLLIKWAEEEMAKLLKK